MKLKKLSFLTSVLFVISILVYSHENKRGTDLLAGSDYIKGLDVNKIQKIVLSFQNEKKVILTRDSHRFLLKNHQYYPALNSKVNDLIYKIASIQVNEKIVSQPSQKDLDQYELSENKRKYFVQIYDNDDKEIVSFSVGKSYKGRGNYLYKSKQNDIYLSKKNLVLMSSYKDFIDTVLLNFNKEDVKKITLKYKDKDMKLEILKDEKENFKAVDMQKKKIKSEKVKNYINGLQGINFDSYISSSSPTVNSLSFLKNVQVEFKNKLIYNLSLAQNENEYFVKISALLNESNSSLLINQNDGDEDLKKVQEVIDAQAQAQSFNMEKGSWVYKIKKSVYEKLAKEHNFFF